uniref:G_PROTEIN_RECEP_F1_2 domain-containing protein n=1 Tax=Globodera pallida TaxID=36090 RepID=A0A183CA38_GLOPA
MLVLVMFRRFEVFHSNLRTLLWHFLLCILLNLYLQMIRILTPILQQFWRHTDNAKIQFEKCVPYNEIPALFCAFICVSGILICMERLYASLRYVKYENECFEPFLSHVFNALWTILALCSMWQFVNGIASGISPNNPYFQCQIHFVHVNPLKTHWHTLFAILIFIVYCIVMNVILTLNRKKKEEYIEFYYSSLNHRFQIGENLKTALLIIITNCSNVFIRHRIDYHSFLDSIQLEVQINCQRIHEYGLAKYRAALWRRNAENGDLTNQFNQYCMSCGKLQSKHDVAKCGGILLREYWDDYLHIE